MKNSPIGCIINQVGECAASIGFDVSVLLTFPVRVVLHSLFPCHAIDHLKPLILSLFNITLHIRCFIHQVSVCTLWIGFDVVSDSVLLTFPVRVVLPTACLHAT